MRKTYTAKEISEILKVSTTTLQDWKKSERNFDEVYDEEWTNRINPEKMMRWLYQWKKDCEKDVGDASDRKKLADAMIAELKYKERCKALVPKRLYIEQEIERMLLVKAMMMSQAEQVAGSLKLTPIQKEEILSISRSNIEILKSTFESKEKEWLEKLNEQMKDELKGLEDVN